MYNANQRAKASISVSHTLANIYLQKSIAAESDGDMVEAERCMEEYYINFDQLLEKSLSQKDQALIISQAFAPKLLQPLASDWQVPPDTLKAVDPLMPTVFKRNKHRSIPVGLWNAAKAKGI